MSQEIANTVVRFFRAIDNRDWAAAEALMTNPYHLDYASFGAGEAADLSPREILSGWKGLLPGFDHTHHQIGNLEIEDDGDRATARCYVTATHVIADAMGGSVWTVVGRYSLSLRRDEMWRLNGTVFHFKYQDGNTGLPALASERASQTVEPV